MGGTSSSEKTSSSFNAAKSYVNQPKQSSHHVNETHQEIKKRDAELESLKNFGVTHMHKVVPYNTTGYI